MNEGFLLREFFHLLALRGLSARLSNRVWAVKGGICLRLFHLSPRLSEDMDLDIDPKMAVRTLEKTVSEVLGSAGLKAALSVRGVSGLKWSPAKQTATTQRWKIGLERPGAGALPTKIEFSRRTFPFGALGGVPSRSILQEHGLPPFAARYYSASAIAAQKIIALASPARNAARDLFDLCQLFRMKGTIEGIKGIDAGVREASLEKIMAFTRRDFAAQVAPFLPADLAELHGSKNGFQNLAEECAAGIGAVPT